MTNNAEKIETTSKPKLLLRPTSNKPITTTTSLFFPNSPIASGVFIVPLKQKFCRKGGRTPPKKHLRKPPSFDTYIRSSATATPANYGYRMRTTRTPSVSSSYSSTSSLLDNASEYANEEEMMIYGYGSQKSASVSSSSVSRHHRRNSSAFRVRFADVSDDGSSIVSSSSGGSVDEWDDMEEEEEEEDYIFVPQSSPPHHYFGFHEKSDST